MTEPLPLPAPSPSPASSTIPEGTRDGDMTLAWRLTLTLGWIAAFFAYAAVWQASVQLGIATWWVGPRSQAAPAYIRVLPFALAIVVILLIVYNVRQIARLSLFAAGLSILIALPDLSRSIGLAVVELIISAAMIVLSTVSSTGRYRALPAVPEGLAASPGVASPDESDPGVSAAAPPDRH